MDNNERMYTEEEIREHVIAFSNEYAGTYNLREKSKLTEPLADQVQEDQKKYPDAPFSYNNEEHESVGMNSGSLNYSITDLHLPGRNGFDLVLNRTYRSLGSNDNDMNIVQRKGRVYFFQLTLTETVYRSGQLYEYYEWFVDEGGPYANTTIRNEYGRESLAEYSYMNETITEQWGGYTWRYVMKLRLDSYDSGLTDISYISGTRPNDTYLKLYQLGYGWSFNFPSIESVPENHKTGNVIYHDFLHLEDGRVLKIKSAPTSTTASNLLYNDDEPYSLTDIRVYRQSINASTTYLHYKDGRVATFQNNRLSDYEDRFGNRISFMYNNGGLSSIIDSVGRTIKINKEQIDTNSYYLRLVSSDTTEVLFSYYVVNNELRQTIDAMNRVTIFSYTITSANETIYPTEHGWDPVPIKYHILREITHHTGARSTYNYKMERSFLGLDGYKEFPVISSRRDTAENRTFNQIGYAFAVNGKYISRATVTKQDGTIETHSFNKDSLPTTMTVASGSKTVKYHSFQFGAANENLRLLVSSVSRIYNSDGVTYAESRVNNTYDSAKTGNIIMAEEIFPQNTDLNNTTSRRYGANSILTEETVQKDASTSITTRNTLRSDGKVIASTMVYEVRGSVQVLKERTTYEYDSSSRVSGKRRYLGDNLTTSIDFNETRYHYESNYTDEPSAVDVIDVKDADGNLISSPDGAGVIRQSFFYDYMGRLTSEVDGMGNERGIAYDKVGRVVRKTLPDGSTESTDYDDADNTVTVTDSNGNQRRTEYNPLGIAKRQYILNPQTLLVEYDYDQLGRVTGETTHNEDGTVRLTTTMTYDALGRVTEKTSSGVGVNAAEAYAYNDAYQRKYFIVQTTAIGDNTAPSVVSSVMTDQKGNTVENRVGELAVTYTYDKLGNQLSRIDGRGHTTRWEYDFDGQVTKETNALGQSAMTTYDTLGRKVSVTGYRGETAHYTYDGMDRLILTDTPFDSRRSMTKTYYDRSGSAVRVMNLLDHGTWRISEYEYDSRQRQTASVVYDDNGKKIAMRTEYDGNGNKLEVHTGLTENPNDPPAITSYTYGRFDNILSMTDPMGGVERFIYDATGLLLVKQDRNGNLTSLEYDAMDRVLRETADNNDVRTEKSYAYSRTGQKAMERITETREDGSSTLTILYRYDNIGRLIRQEDPMDVEKTYDYDAAGNRISFTLERGGVTEIALSYTYDQLDRMIEVNKYGTPIAVYTYDTAGNRDSLAYPDNGVETRYQYNDANLITRLENKRGGSVTSSWDYTYALDGNQLSKTDVRGGTTTYIYSKLGQLVRESDPDWNTIAYTYDRFGNRAQTEVTGAENYTTEYEYDLRNRLLRELKTSNDVTETWRYGYDENGSLISKEWQKATAVSADAPPGSVHFATANVHADETVLELRSYNGFDQLIKVYRDGVQTLYQYRPDGLRHNKVTGKAARSRDEDQLTTHVWDGIEMVLEVSDNSSVKARYLRGMGLIAQCIDASTFYYLHNAHGDVVQRIDALGNAAPEYRYDAFGNQRDPVTTDPNPFRYCGEYFDQESGAYYLRSRYYSPVIGRFTQEDIAKDGLNWYTYCEGNPVQFIDPLGLALVDTVDYARAMGAEVTQYTVNGQLKTKITYNGITKLYNVKSGKINDTSLNTVFGFSSFLTDNERNTGVGIGIRNNSLYKDIITPGKDYYDLDYNGYTIRLWMDEYSMAVNLATGDAGMLSLNYDESYWLASWLKNIYYDQFGKEYELSTAAIAVELRWHAYFWEKFSQVPYVGEHARIANIGTKEVELRRERWLWDQLGDYGTFGSRRTPLPPL